MSRLSDSYDNPAEHNANSEPKPIIPLIFHRELSKGGKFKK